MASETIDDADEPQKRSKWGENIKVYMRRTPKKPLDEKSRAGNVTVSATTNLFTSPANRISNSLDVAATTSSATISNGINGKGISKESDTVPQKCPLMLPTNEANLPRQQQDPPGLNEIPIQEKQAEATARNDFVRPSENGSVKPILTRVNDRFRINLKHGRRKNEIRDLKSKFANELDQVRSVVKRLEDEEVLLCSQSTASGAGGHSRYSMNDDRSLTRVYSDVGSVAQYDSRPFRPATVAIMENDHGSGELGDNEKGTPRANQYGQNSEFLLGRDRFPPEMSNKKWKSYGGKKRGRQGGHWSAVDKYITKSYKGCGDLLTRLMKHKHGWVFNKPVDVEALKLHDYHDIIKNPMDLGTVKTRLSKHLYKSPMEFAEDVKLTFNNSMTYNPKGHEVHGMAEELLKIFEAKWPAIESDYNLALRYEMVQDGGLPTPTSRPRNMGLPTPSLRPSDSRNLEIPDSSVLLPFDPKPKSNVGGGRAPVLKKPKAKDLHKRDMTYDEKQKLSANLQSLPSEKLPDIVQIIKKRNSVLSQHDDEIELDIDRVDAETLWELDRLASNFKKSVNKKKRKAEIVVQVGSGATPRVSAIGPAPLVMKSLEHSKIGEKSDAIPLPDQRGRKGDSVGGSSSSSSSGSESGSSSSDSDSDSSSSNGSERGRSPGT